VVTLVFLYQIIPSYLEVPEDKRVVHYAVSLIATFILMMVLGAILGTGGMARMEQQVSMSGPPPLEAGAPGGIHQAGPAGRGSPGPTMQT